MWISPAIFSGEITAPEDGQYEPVVVEQRASKRAFLVQSLVGERQVIQRPLDPFCKNLPIINGTALLDGGGMALLLNVNELMQAATIAHRENAPVPAGASLVLVVDDSEMTRDMVVSLLRSKGYRVNEAVDGLTLLPKPRTTLPLSSSRTWKCPAATASNCCAPCAPMQR